ncbi:hypothetical protein ACFLT7_03385 [candidate division KSB1 bacterium]
MRSSIRVILVLGFAALIFPTAPAVAVVSAEYIPMDVPADHQSVEADWERFVDARRYPATLTSLKPGMWSREVTDVLGRQPDRMDYSLTTYGKYQEWHYPDGVTLYFTYGELDSWRIEDRDEPESDTGLLKKIIRGLMTALTD